MTRRTELLERAPRTVLPKEDQRVLCAVSGGLDSMCLLFMLDSWCKDRGGQVIAAHFNHQLRGAEADRDEAFVREACARRRVPLTAGRGDVRSFAEREGLSLEEAARTLRYAFLHRAAETEGCERIYTAHHADDNAETVLLNLVRGTGLRGLTGMDWRRGPLFRPLLEVSREELAEYATRWDIPHVEDETNANPDAASRNFLRLRVMPLLKELNPRAAEHICQTAGQLRTVDSSLEEDAAARTDHAERQKGRVILSVDALDHAPDAVRPRMLLRLFDLLGGAFERHFGFDPPRSPGERGTALPAPRRHRPVLPEAADSGAPAPGAGGGPADSGRAPSLGGLHPDPSGAAGRRGNLP